MSTSDDVKQNKRIELLEKALDCLALALTDNNHLWTQEQRKLYEDAMREAPNA